MNYSNVYRCVVEDIDDPKFLGRVRLRVLGVHSANLELIPTDSLNWCDVVQGADVGSGLGWTSNLRKGVWGYSLCLNESQTEFLFLGASKPNGRQ